LFLFATCQGVVRYIGRTIKNKEFQMSTPSHFNLQERPGMVTAIAIMTLLSGIVNLFWGLVMGGSLLVSVVLACIAPLGLLPIVLGIYEIIFAAKLLSNPPQKAQPATAIAILEICTLLFGNVFSAVVGVLSLVFYNDLQVKDFFNRLNGMPGYEVVPATPIPPSAPEPVPAPVEETPAPPKPRGRKIAENEDLSDK